MAHSLYLTGQLPEIIDNYPEVKTFRDLIFLFKLLMVPTATGLPELKCWHPRDADLTWNYDLDKKARH